MKFLSFSNKEQVVSERDCDQLTWAQGDGGKTQA